MSIAVGAILLLVGLFHLAFPYATWFLSIGWKLRDAEPSEAYLGFTRVGGGIGAGIGLIVLVIGIVQIATAGVYNGDSFTTFTKEMTVQNIASIKEQNAPIHATPAQIREFVRDIRAVDISYEVSGGGFAAANSFTISCRDGYTVSLVNVDNAGTFGIASGVGASPNYEFDSSALIQWVWQVESHPPGQ